MDNTCKFNIFCVVGFVAVIGFVLVAAGCAPSEEEKELARLQPLEKKYRKVVTERSKKMTKSVVKQTYNPNNRGEDTTYTVTDAGIHTTQYGSIGIKSNLFWYGDISKIYKCYFDDEDYCVCTEGKSDFHICFNRGIRRDEYYRAYWKELHSFRDRWKSL